MTNGDVIPSRIFHPPCNCLECRKRELQFWGDAPVSAEDAESGL